MFNGSFHNQLIALQCIILWSVYWCFYRSYLTLIASPSRSWRDWRSGAVVFLCVVLSVAVILFKDSYLATNFNVSDSVEYAVTAQRLGQGKLPELTFDTLAVPSRFQVWFSAFVLYPWYLMNPDNLGVGIYGVFTYVLIGVSGLYLLGCFSGGRLGGIAAVMLLLASPSFRYFSREILTDVPTMSLWLITCMMSISIIRSREESVLDYAACGLLVGIATSIRPLSIMLAVPLLMHICMSVSRRWLMKCIIFCIPTLFLVNATFLLNIRTFGSPFRTGYHLWLSIPYDFPSLVFSLDYVFKNLKTLLGSTSLPFLLLVIFSLPIVRRFQDSEKTSEETTDEIKEQWDRIVQLLKCCIACSLLLILVHLVYFYQTPRFFLPVVGLLCAVAGGIIASAVPGSFRNSERCRVGIVALLVCGAGLSLGLRNPIPTTRVLIDTIHRTTANDAVIISGLNPLQLEALCVRGSERIIMPVSRRVEFASKVLMWHAPGTLTPPPNNPFDHRATSLMQLGAFDLYPFVALSSIEHIRHLIDSGREVVVVTVSLTEEELSELKRSFTFSEFSPGISRLGLPAQVPSGFV